jgi:hypothetical protein
MGWRNCAASLALVAEVNERWPRRDRTSDGTIGDAAHAARSSDHNPGLVVAGQGVVRARDIDVDGVDMAWLVEHLRQLGAAGDRRLAGGGYLIFNRRITRPDFTGWKVYTGTNPHDHHAHVSFSRDPAGFDSTAPWGIATAAAPAAPTALEGFLMALTDAEQREILDGIRKLKPGLGLPARSPNCRVKGDDHFGAALNAWAEAADGRAAVEALARQIAAMGPAGGPAQLSDADVQRVAAAVVAQLGHQLTT